MGVINELHLLKEAGCTNIEQYTLVSNYGYTFSKGGVEYDLRYWENCYGVYGGGWSLHSCQPVNGKHRSSPSFGEDFEKAIDWIKLYL